LASELVVIKESGHGQEKIMQENHETNKFKENIEKIQLKEDVENIDIDDLIIEKEHINTVLNKILDDFVGFSNAEIIEVQLNCFREHLNNAFKDKVRKIVFIHGIGNGTLKNSLRHELETIHKKKCYYQDASFKEYGFGATLVFVRQNSK